MSAPASTPAGPAASVSHLSRKQCERFFRRQGLPLLVDSHTVGRDVFGRSASFLVVVVLMETVTLVDRQWDWWQNLLAVLGGLVAVLGLYALLNVLRRRHPLTAPQSIGWPELAFFVLAPPVVALAVAAEWRVALTLAVTNVVLLAAVRVLVGLGLLSTLGWGLSRLADELGSSLRRLVRLLPLVLIFSIVLFYNTEVWQVFDRVSGQADIALALLFLALIVVLTAFGARREADAVIADAAPHASPAATAFSTPQRRNIVAMVAASQLLQVLVVSLATGAFFVLIGVLTITPEVREAWAITNGWRLTDIPFFGAPLMIDQTLVRVAVALATFNGLYYAINVQVDAVYRTELIEDVTAQLNDVVRVREHYLTLLRP